MLEYLQTVPLTPDEAAPEKAGPLTPDLWVTSEIPTRRHGSLPSPPLSPTTASSPAGPRRQAKCPDAEKGKRGEKGLLPYESKERVGEGGLEGDRQSREIQKDARERRARAAAEIKAESDSPDVAAAATSQLLLRGLLHLHFGLKIAPA